MSLTEILTKSLINTILGMGVVFSVLIFISFIISLFKYLPGLTANLSKSKKVKAEIVTDEPEVIIETCEEKDPNVTIAIITAAIRAAMNDNEPQGDGYFVRSIRRV